MWPFTRGPSVRQQLNDAHAYVATLQADNAALIDHINALHRTKETLLTADGIKQQTIDALTDRLAEVTQERDTIRTKRSEAISRGNRTRAAKRVAGVRLYNADA